MLYVKSLNLSSNIASQKVAALSVAFHPNSELKRVFIGGSDGVIRCVQWVSIFCLFKCVFIASLSLNCILDYWTRDIPHDRRYSNFSTERKVRCGCRSCVPLCSHDVVLAGAPRGSILSERRQPWAAADLGHQRGCVGVHIQAALGRCACDCGQCRWAKGRQILLTCLHSP